MKELKIRDICTKGSSTLKQKDIPKDKGKYPVYGASGIIGYRDTYDQANDYIGIVKDGSGIGRVMFLPAKSSVIGTLQYILPKPGFNIHYIGYCLESLGLDRFKQGAAIPHIYFRDYGEKVVRVEQSLDEQVKVVEHLKLGLSKIEEMLENAKRCYNDATLLMHLRAEELMEPRKNWKTKTLAELSLIKGDYGYNYSSKTFDGMRYLRITDITDWGELIPEKVSADTNEDTSTQKLKEGDLLFARTGATVGKTLMYKKEHGPCCFAGYLIRYRLNPELVLPKFAFYFAHTGKYYEWVCDNQKVAAQPNISAKIYNLLQLSFPGISEQQSIIEELDSLYAKMVDLHSNFDVIEKDCKELRRRLLQKSFE